MGTPLRRLEAGVAVALLLLGAFAIWEGARMPQGSAALPGPGMLPVALGVLLALCAVALMVRSGAGAERVAIGHRHIAMGLLAVLGAGLLWERAGFLVTSTLFLFALLWSLSPLGWWRSLIAAVVATVAVRYFFQNLLNVVLPSLPFAF
ncbi:MAG: tripartite tricarboxylate transporter TctB family protein [Burkholderiales bacterium]